VSKCNLRGQHCIELFGSTGVTSALQLEEVMGLIVIAMAVGLLVATGFVLFAPKNRDD
jgi:hypothetical protein